MVFSRLVAYKKNNLMLLASLAFSALSLVNYFYNFDILAPGINEGSVRVNMGSAFILPVLILTSVQILYSAGVLHLVTRSFFFEKRDFLKAYFCASLLVLMYSFFYTLFPYWGPYLFLVGSFRGTTASGYVQLSAWTAVLIVSISLAIRKVYGLERQVRWPVIFLLSGALFTLVLALAD